MNDSTIALPYFDDLVSVVWTDDVRLWSVPSATDWLNSANCQPTNQPTQSQIKLIANSLIAYSRVALALMEVISTRGLHVLESASNEKFNCSLNLLMLAAAAGVVVALTLAVPAAVTELTTPDPPAVIAVE